ncbi:ABC transporter substrate-binding protein [Nocardioides sp. BP30]|uniref:ABC transporter substrate-binding protein n=1 Tax=Nocardioides sp. BP30 TaxID=3036374 RepID=UPI002468339E|nr:ABC transporter substrate-binding protein [Nocardioides sp. BP30]WGL52807.1 ABC transporter substrate-binding protein [Nocardioides sp. BP30]
MTNLRSPWLQATLVGLVALSATACSSGHDDTASDAAGTAGAASSGTASAQPGDPAAAALVPAEIRKRGSITIATDPSYPPLEYADADSGDLKGMEVDLGNALGKELGLQVKWTKVAFNSIVPGLQAGRYDMALSGFWVFPDRLKVTSMITYFESGSQYMVKAGSSLKIDTRADLCGTTVALESGSSEIEMNQTESKTCQAEGQKPITVQTYQTQDQANLAVTSGRAQSTGVGAEVAGYTVKNAHGQLALAGAIFDSSPAGIAFPKNSALLPAADAALTTMSTDGSLKKLFSTYGVSDQQIALKLNK